MSVFKIWCEKFKQFQDQPFLGISSFPLIHGIKSQCWLCAVENFPLGKDTVERKWLRQRDISHLKNRIFCVFCKNTVRSMICWTKTHLL